MSTSSGRPRVRLQAGDASAAAFGSMRARARAWSRANGSASTSAFNATPTARRGDPRERPPYEEPLMGTPPVAAKSRRSYTIHLGGGVMAPVEVREWCCSGCGVRLRDAQRVLLERRMRDHICDAP